MNGNKQLKGCIPVTGYSVVQYADTAITGLCFGDPGSIERAQIAAMDTHFRRLLRFGQINVEYDRMVDTSVTQVSALGNIVDVGQARDSLFASSYITEDNIWETAVQLEVEVVGGVEYVTSVVVDKGGLNLTHLPQLAAAFPNLKRFVCRHCVAVNNDTHPYAAVDKLLPPALPAAAPLLEHLDLTYSNIQGTLPLEYGNWPSLQKMILQRNELTGVYIWWPMFEVPHLRAASLSA